MEKDGKLFQLETQHQKKFGRKILETFQSVGQTVKKDWKLFSVLGKQLKKFGNFFTLFALEILMADRKYGFFRPFLLRFFIHWCLTRSFLILVHLIHFLQDGTVLLPVEKNVTKQGWIILAFFVPVLRVC